jgi:hypothetical protein
VSAQACWGGGLLSATRFRRSQVHGFCAAELFLHTVVACRADSLHALAAVKGLSVPAVLALLRYLTKLANLYVLLPPPPRLVS